MSEAQQRDGVRGVDIRMRHRRFSARFFIDHRAYEPPHLRGMVIPHPRGARVVAKCGRSRWVFAAPSVAAAFLIYSLATWGRVDRTLVAVSVVLCVIGWTQYYTVTARSSRDASDLLDRFHRALDHTEGSVEVHQPAG